MKNGPWRITFDTNPDDCNLSCIMCEDHSQYSDTQARRIREGNSKRRMNIEVIERVLNELRDHPPKEIIPSTMGEPLIYKDFNKIIELCHAYGIKLNLTTNGTFPKHGAAEWGRRIVPVGSDVKISFNGITGETQESIMCDSNLEAVLNNIKAFIAVRDEVAASGGNYCSVTLQATFLQSNVRELPGIVRLAAELGVDRFKGHHLWVHWDQISGLSMRRNRESINEWNEIVGQIEQTAENHRRLDGSKVKLANVFRLDVDAIDDIAPGGDCPFLGEEAWINASGRFDPCCAPDEQRKTLGSFGNVMEKGFLEIWHGEAYRKLIETYQDHCLCKTCNMRRPDASIGTTV